MAALTAPKPVSGRVSQGALTVDWYLPVAAGVTIFQGALVVVQATGFARPGRASTTDVAIGIAQETVINTGIDGAKSVRVKAGTFAFENSAAADLIGAAFIGRDVFIVDDQTVAATNGTNTRARAGKCVGIECGKVHVQIAPT